MYNLVKSTPKLLQVHLRLNAILQYFNLDTDF